MRITKPAERWFDIPNDPDNGRLCIRQLTPGEISEIFDASMNQTISYVEKDGKFEPNFQQTLDKKKDRELTISKILVNWQNMFDENGDVLEFSKENVIRAINEIQGFNELVGELRRKLDEEISKEKKSKKKTSSGSAKK